MSDSIFIGVHATSELPSTLGAPLRPMVRKKRLWFVWEGPEGSFIVQPLNAILEPMANPRQITAREFETRFTPEPSCQAAPTCPLPPESIPDPESTCVMFPDQESAEPVHGELRADDPNLLRNWLEAPPPLRLHQGELSAVQQVALSRIVQESLEDTEADREDPEHTPANSHGEPLQEHSLRSGFALGLLQIKQGRREEGEKNLEALITNPNVNPYDGQLVFSEFGLNLRRLGLVQLALKAHLRALEWTPNDERVHFNLARTYHDLNQVDLAVEHLRTALDLAPDFATARHFLSFLEGKPSV